MSDEIATAEPSSGGNDKKSKAKLHYMDKGPQREVVLALTHAFQGLSNGAKAGLRRRSSYSEVISEASQAYYLTLRELNSRNHKISPEVLGSMLILLREKSAGGRGVEIGKKSLGNLCCDSGNPAKVKIGRMRKMLRATTLDEGFPVLQSILRQLRDHDINWIEIANLLTAWAFESEDWQRQAYRRICDEYFARYKFGET